jgi:hypothetical protein
MRQTVRYLVLIIPSKLRVDVRLSVDEEHNPEYRSTSENGDKNVSLSMFPFVGISIMRPGEIGEDGRRIRAPWNPNDHLTLTKFTLPIFIHRLKEIQANLRIKELYKYQGKRLELDEEIAKDVRLAFMIGQSAVELTPVVIVQDDDSRVEGIKMKFNNEQSHVLLTLNELYSLYHNLTYIDVDIIALNIYNSYISRNGSSSFNSNRIVTAQKKDIDIPF